MMDTVTSLIESDCATPKESPMQTALSGNASPPTFEVSNELVGLRIVPGYIPFHRSYSVYGPESEMVRCNRDLKRYAKCTDTYGPSGPVGVGELSRLSVPSVTGYPLWFDVANNTYHGVGTTLFLATECDPYNTSGNTTWPLPIWGYNGNTNVFINAGVSDNISFTDTEASGTGPNAFSIHRQLSDEIDVSGRFGELLSDWLATPFSFSDSGGTYGYDEYGTDGTGEPGYVFNGSFGVIPGRRFNSRFIDQYPSLPGEQYYPANWPARPLAMHATTGWNALTGAAEYFRCFARHTNPLPQMYWIGSATTTSNGVTTYKFLSRGFAAKNQVIGLGQDIDLPMPQALSIPLTSDSTGFPIVSIKNFAVIGIEPDDWAALSGASLVLHY